MNDQLQIREVTLLEALVQWGESRVASSDKPLLDVLAELMEHVRFPTMSVSDLHGKVRPLVREDAIHESLLTEALFYHLKWGTVSERAFKRTKPRAGAAALVSRLVFESSDKGVTRLTEPLFCTFCGTAETEASVVHAACLVCSRDTTQWRCFNCYLREESCVCVWFL